MSSPKNVEERAIVSMLMEAKPHNLHKIQLFSHALEVSRAINGSPDWSIQSILMDTSELSADFDIVSLTSSPRWLMALLMVSHELLWEGLFLWEEVLIFWLGG